MDTSREEEATKRLGQPLYRLVSALIPVLCLAFAADSTARPGGAFRDKNVRDAYVREKAKQVRRAKLEAVAWARERGLPVRVDDGRRVIELMFVENGRPFYYTTDNANAAISTATDLVRDTAPYNFLNGEGYTVGIWDGGSVRSTHQEFNSNSGARVNVMDGASNHWHSTHVGGTIGAEGQQASARGMAPSVTIDSYDWNDDTSEMAYRGAASPREAGAIEVSNQSYGYISGWYQVIPEGPFYWTESVPWGDETTREPLFGQYDSWARDTDDIVYNAPYFLPFKSAGNDRNDNPSNGSTVYYKLGGPAWKSTTYNSAEHPPGDGIHKSGYDTISSMGVAKNIMCVAAVNDAVSGGSRSVGNATLTSFTCWGPTDDGRIKPDISANGVNLYSCRDNNDGAYAIASGTSMSSPNAAGSAILLQEYYGDYVKRSVMWSSRVLLCHLLRFSGILLHITGGLRQSIQPRNRLLFLPAWAS